MTKNNDENDYNDVTNSKILENIRCGYSNAINLWIYEGNSIWNKIAAMITTNTILFATIGIIINATKWHALWELIPILSILGILLCVCWFILNRRSFIYYQYWIVSARNLEKSLTNIETVINGNNFLAIRKRLLREKSLAYKALGLDKKSIRLDKKAEKLDKTCSIFKYIDKIRVEWITNIILVVFILAYIVILIYIKDMK
jgi:hypothetical protein